MKTYIYTTELLIFLFTVTILAGCKKELSQPHLNTNESTDSYFSQDDENWTIVPGKYIAVLKSDYIDKNLRWISLNRDQRRSFIAEEFKSIFEESTLKTVTIDQIYSNSIKGIALRLEDAEFELLKKNSKIAYIEPERVISLGKPSKPGNGGGGSDPAQTIPWGILRVGYGNGIGKTAWIIDTGIDLDHPDLNVNKVKSVSFLSLFKRSDPDDENGHGTHVAGTIAALNNAFGVIGVAAGAAVVSVRVLDRKGMGYLSDVIAGIDYVGSEGNRGDVANLSLTGGASQALDDAVLTVSEKGILFAIAAGNSSSDATGNSPARVNGSNIFTVSAMTNRDHWASFSNFGNPPIDFCAPGVSIYSTWKDGSYNTISGTSMATPHVAGLLLLNGTSLHSDGYVSFDPDGNPDPIAHK